MTNFRTFLFLAAATPLLAGCNATGPTARADLGAPQAAAVAVAPKAAMPSGTACGESINRFDAVVTSDLETGNVNKPVYESIQRDLGPARSACLAGRGGEAVGMVSASRKRHGYPG